MTKLRLAIQKKGRLSEKSLAIFKACGIHIHTHSQKLLVSASNFDLEILFVRNDDIPKYIEDGVADIGIIGENVLLEKQCDFTVVEKLGFGGCRMSLAVPKAFDYNSVKDLDGLNIATSYPVILKNYLAEQGVQATIHVIGGSVEVAPNIGMAEGIFDIVSTGSTLISNGLKEVEHVLKSEAVLVSDKNISAAKQIILDKLLFRMRSVQKAKYTKYLLLNSPNDKLDDVIKQLPGITSPTIMPLAMKGWSSVHTVIGEDDFWDIIEKLKEAGAEGILVAPIEKMID